MLVGQLEAESQVGQVDYLWPSLNQLRKQIKSVSAFQATQFQISPRFNIFYLCYFCFQYPQISNRGLVQRSNPQKISPKYFFILICMGNNRSIDSMAVAQPLSANWQFVEHTDYCDILRNTLSGEEAQLQLVTLSGHLNEQYQRFDYRFKQEQNLVRVLNATQQKPSHLCSTHTTLHVLTERIPYLLADVQNLPVSESLCVLHESLMGFMAIHQFEKYVTVSDDMIGFTPEGRTKVWLNPNFGKNHPVEEDWQVIKQEEPVLAGRMIEQIFGVVERHTVNGQLPGELKRAFDQERPRNFVQAINLVRDYCSQTGAKIAGYVNVPTRLGFGTKGSRTKIQQGTPIVTRTVTTEYQTIPQQQQPQQQSIVINQQPVTMASHLPITTTTVAQQPHLFVTPPSSQQQITLVHPTVLVEQTPRVVSQGSIVGALPTQTILQSPPMATYRTSRARTMPTSTVVAPSVIQPKIVQRQQQEMVVVPQVPVTVSQPALQFQALRGTNTTTNIMRKPIAFERPATPVKTVLNVTEPKIVSKGTILNRNKERMEVAHQQHLEQRRVIVQNKKAPIIPPNEGRITPIKVTQNSPKKVQLLAQQQKVKIDEYKLPVRQEQIKKWSQQYNQFSKNIEQKPISAPTGKIAIEVKQKPSTAVVPAAQGIRGSASSKQVADNASNYHFSFLRNVVNTSNETPTDSKEIRKEHTSAFEFFKNEQSKKATTATTITKPATTTISGPYISNGLSFFVGQLPQGMRVAVPSPMPSSTTPQMQHFPQGAAREVRKQTVHQTTSQQQIAAGASASVTTQAQSVNIVNTSQLYQQIQQQQKQAQLLQQQKQQIQAQQQHSSSTLQHQVTTSTTTTTVVRDQPTEGERVIIESRKLQGVFDEFKKRLAGERNEAKPQDFSLKPNELARPTQPQISGGVGFWNRQPTLQANSQGNFQHPLAVRTDIKLQRPAVAPQAQPQMTSERALQILSFPIIEIMEYMPEKGVQFPDPDDMPAQQYIPAPQQYIPRSQQVPEISTKLASGPMVPPAPTNKYFQSFKNQQQTQVHSDQQQPGAQVHEQEQQPLPDDHEPETDQGYYLNVEYQEYLVHTDQPPQQPQVFGEVFNTGEYHNQQLHYQDHHNQQHHEQQHHEQHHQQHHQHQQYQQHYEEHHHEEHHQQHHDHLEVQVQPRSRAQSYHPYKEVAMIEQRESEAFQKEMIESQEEDFKRRESGEKKRDQDSPRVVANEGELKDTYGVDNYQSEEYYSNWKKQSGAQDSQPQTTFVRRPDKKSSVVQAGLRVIYGEQPSSPQKPHLQNIQQAQLQDTRNLQNPPRTPATDSVGNFPSTVVINGEVYPYPKKIVSKYQTIIATQTDTNDRTKHNTTIDKQERCSAVMEPVLVYDREGNMRDYEGRGEIEGQQHEFKADVEYIKRKYGLGGGEGTEEYKVDTSLDKYETSFAHKVDTYKPQSSYNKYDFSSKYETSYKVDSSSPSKKYATNQYESSSSSAFNRDEIDKILARYATTNTGLTPKTKSSRREDVRTEFSDASFMPKDSRRRGGQKSESKMSYEELRTKLLGNGNSRY